MAGLLGPFKYGPAQSENLRRTKSEELGGAGVSGNKMTWGISIEKSTFKQSWEFTI